MNALRVYLLETTKKRFLTRTWDGTQLNWKSTRTLTMKGRIPSRYGPWPSRKRFLYN